MIKGSKLPKKDAVLFVLKQVFKKHGTVESLRELTDLVRINLKNVDPSYYISSKRLRMITIESPEIRMKIQTKRGKKVSKCPSCGRGLKKIHTKNLRGRKILVKLKCSKCGYTGASGKWIPRRYVFSKKQKIKFP